MFCLSLLLALVISTTAMPANNGYGPEPVVQYSGFFTVNQTTTENIFYWFFESRSNANGSSTPLVLWMTGGPGCSSMTALFEENGPYKIQDNLDLSINPWSWNSNAHLIFIDQPPGTGFSYSPGFDDYTLTSTAAADYVYSMLLQFFAAYPKYAHLPFFVFGESYSGHYVPAVATRILSGNQESPSRSINLQGCGIGDGWVDPIPQYKSYPIYAYQNGLINNETYKLLNESASLCETLILAGDDTAAYLECSAIMFAIVLEGGLVNWYDITKKCPIDLFLSGCYNFSIVETFLNQPPVRQQLGVDPRVVKFVNCNSKYLFRMYHDDLTSYRDELAAILNQGIRVMSYNGLNDLICNHVGEIDLYTTMPWKGASFFRNDTPSPYYVNGDQAGTVQEGKNFSFLTVIGAGHMVPMDQPQIALFLLNTFLSNKPFN